MKRTRFAPALIAAALSLSFAGGAVATPPLLHLNPQLIPLQPLVPLPLPILCPNLGVSISIVADSTPQNWRITVRVSNVSPVNFNSGPGQQRLTVHRVGGLGGGGETLSFDFQQIAHGASRSWSFVRPVPEGPYSYDAALWISPSVYTDANAFNNECHTNNNTAHAQT